MKFKNKALSPLIATILLIVIAVILVTIVMSWGKNFATESLAEADTITNDACTDAVGALAITDCSIDSSGVVTFYVKNISRTYDFSSSDVFTMDFLDNSGNMDTGLAINAQTAPTSWSGLSIGKTVQVKVPDANLTNITSTTGTTRIDVTVKSSVCPTDAEAKFLKCHH